MGFVCIGKRLLVLSPPKPFYSFFESSISGEPQKQKRRISAVEACARQNKKLIVSRPQKRCNTQMTPTRLEAPNPFTWPMLRSR